MSESICPVKGKALASPRQFYGEKKSLPCLRLIFVTVISSISISLPLQGAEFPL